MACVFCSIAAGSASATIIREWPDALAIRPRSGGVNDGHLLVLPRVHVEDAGTDPEVTATVMRRAAELMAEHSNANVITSKGAAGTQTVTHLHGHLVPRTAGDGLPSPGPAPPANRSPPDEVTCPPLRLRARRPLPRGPGCHQRVPRDARRPAHQGSGVDVHRLAAGPRI